MATDIDIRIPLVILGLAALLAALLVAFVAATPQDAEATDLTGSWRIDFIVQSAQVEADVGSTFACMGSVTQSGETLESRVDCGTFTADLNGFASAGRSQVFLSGELADGEAELSADVVSSAQIVGAWHSSDGSAGRFVAIRTA